MSNTRQHALQLALPHGLPMSPQSDSGSCSASAPPSRNDMVVVAEHHDIGKQLAIVEREHFAVGEKYRRLITQGQQLNQHHAQDNYKLAVYNRRIYGDLTEANQRNGQIRAELERVKGREAGLQAANAEMRQKIEEQMVARDRDAEEMQGLRETELRLKSALTTVEATVEATESQLSDLSEHRDSLLVETAALRDMVKSKDEVVSELQADKLVLQEQEEDLKQDIVTLRKEAETAAEELKESCRENTDRAQAIALHAVEVMMLKRRIDTQKPTEEMDEANQQLQKRLEQLQEEHGEKSGELCKELEGWREKYNLEKQALKAAEDKRNREQAQVSHLAAKLKEQQKRTGDLEAQLKAEQETAEHKLANEGKENTWLRSEIRDLKREAQDIKDKVNGTTHGPVVYNDRQGPPEAPAKRQRLGGPSSSYRGRRGRS